MLLKYNSLFQTPPLPYCAALLEQIRRSSDGTMRVLRLPVPFSPASVSLAFNTTSLRCCAFLGTTEGDSLTLRVRSRLVTDAPLYP